MKMKALVLPPKSRLDEVCSEECRRMIREHFDPVWNESGKDYTQEQFAELLPDAEVILTSWGSPVLTEQLLAQAPRLRMIGHAAGTVKGRLPQAAFARGVQVFSAAPRIAFSVGEYCMAVLLASLRMLPRFEKELRQGNWKAALKGFELTGQTVGIVSASSTARAFIRLLAPFQTNILVYDPYLSDEAAERLGVRRAPLEEVMRSRIISVHAPKLPATYRMLNRDLIRLIPDGAIFINSSRADVLDEEAFLEELRTGRFSAALDVFPKEPLGTDSPYHALDNVLLTPHIAGASVQGHLALMEAVVRDMVRSVNGESPRMYEVTERMWETMA